MSSYKQNPTIWLNHLRCTDRHRVGDDTLAVTPAYLPYAAALTPYARWVSIPALVKVRCYILSAYI